MFQINLVDGESVILTPNALVELHRLTPADSFLKGRTTYVLLQDVSKAVPHAHQHPLRQLNSLGAQVQSVLTIPPNLRHWLHPTLEASLVLPTITPFTLVGEYIHHALSRHYQATVVSYEPPLGWLQSRAL
ncbi:hypothetical protein GCM10008960_40940 [Deinococcus sedimenti]|uniref:Uncharacterized protein n=1 Tax=Deinococcus sedimenti TaxID=1867090 RepID=A0ABQ2S994_9DEIO|nr:hypothetical protein GCM10008960_40940 [Deinococcus sedimenti]